MFKAAIFDLDGVMVDTEHIQSRAFEAILKEMGITPIKTKHGTVHVAGGTSHKIWDTLKEQYQFDADTKELINKKRAMVLNVIRQGIEPLPGLLDLLADLQGHAISMAIATSAQKERAELVTEKIGVGKHFTVTITANDVVNVKPAPEVYLKAAELLGVHPRDCVVLEDTDVGVQAGKAAGMKVVAIPNEYTKRMDFSRADKVVDSLSHINHNELSQLFNSVKE